MSRPKPSRPVPAAAIPPKPAPDTVDPIWVLKALGITIVAALLCGYATLSFLFYQGQWQLLLHPTRSTAALTSLGGVSAEPVRFDASETGLPLLSGAYLASPAGGKFSAYSVLYLRSGDGSLAETAEDVANLGVMHHLGLNVFAFDYRGYGQSDPTHPNQERMTQDVAAGLRWLQETRKVPEDHILLFGTGVGARLAVAVAIAHPKIPALIVDAPGADPLAIMVADPRTRALPVRMLLRETFPLTGLATLKTPKLLISSPTPAAPVPAEYRTAADPKTTVELKPGERGPLEESVARFLDLNLR